MKRKLLTIIGSNLKSLGLTILGLSAISASAQISGSYTIDPGGSASASNYLNLNSFAQDLQQITRSDGGPNNNTGSGVTGAVTVTFKANSTESAAAIFPAITGMSASRTVTIDGNGYVVSLSTSNEVIRFSGGDYFTIKNLTVRNTGNSSYARCIWMYNGSDYNTISNCTLEFSALSTASTAGSAFIAFSASQTGNSIPGSHNGSYNTISGNLMRTTSTNSPGPAQAIVDLQGSSVYSYQSSNNTFDKNTIQNFYYMAYYGYYNNGDQFTNNDVSRANSSTNNNYSTLYPIYQTYSYSTTRATKIEGNSIHDLPFSGASESQGPGTLYAMIAQYNYGNTTYRFSLSNNKLTNLRCNGYLYLCYGYGNQFYDLIGNNATTCSVTVSTSSSYYFYGFYSYNSYNYRLNNNTVDKCKGGYYFYGVTNEYPNSSSQYGEINGNTVSNNTNGYYYFYGVRSYFAYNTGAAPIQMMDNKVMNNSIDYYYMYCIYTYYYGFYDIQRNIVYNNKNNGSVGYVYGIYAYYNYGGKINSNLVAALKGYYGSYGIYAYYGTTSSAENWECNQNTVQIDGSQSGYSYHYAYGLMTLMYYNPNKVVTGNIVDLRNNYGAYPCYAYSYTSPEFKQWDYNSFYTSNISYLYYYTITSYAQDFAGWKGLGICGKNEYFGDPKFRNISTMDYRSDIFENQNNVPTQASNPKDVTGAPRNGGKSDRGAVESFMDIKAVSTNFSVPSTVCAGYSISGGTSMTVQNLYPYDTAYGFDVAYSVNGGNKVTEKVTAKMLTNGTSTVTFSKGLVLNQPGTNRIALFVDMPDDNKANDSFIFTTVVKPAPGGGKWNFSSKSTKTIYQFGKNDVTILGEKAIYDINPPRKYSNSQYNQNPGWSASVWATTSNGSTVSGASISANPSGSNDLEYTFTTSQASLEDSMITLYYKVTDNENGCDTIIKRNILVYPTIVPDFTFPAKICDGDAVLFDNKSYVKSGNMEFEWDFGTGNPADITQAPNPVFQFPALGAYTVKMIARTLPYGFEVSKSVTVNVNPIPTVKFTKQNACEGLNLQFTNQTSPSNSSYTWNFGDNTTSTATSPTHMYAQTGQYTVTLKANLNGCVAEVSQRAYQFDKPKADFSLVSGKCDNESFEFDNKSTIKSGLFGSNWDFNDGTVSTEDDVKHQFTSYGAKNVVLVVTSEFGCKDQKTMAVTVKQSPMVDFTNDPACSLTPTDFTNTTPVVSGTIANFMWDFGDGGTSTAENPSHNWTALGPKNVVFTVKLDNGCQSSTSRMMTVGVQPKANFDAQNVCAGDPVVFENNTTWAQGDISYEWNFGDNTTSTNSDPQKSYNVTATTTYNVTLKASITGGCSDQVTKQVTVNEAPTTCDFVANPDYAFGYYGVKLEPVNGSGSVGAQTGVVYTWVFDGGGTETGPSANYNYQNDGTYKVTMRAKVTATGCECSSSKTVTMNRSGVEELEATGITVFPNPNSGVFNVALTENFGDNVTIELTSMSGQVIRTINSTNTGLISVNAGDVADGMYLVRVRSGKRVSTSRINIRK